MQKTEKRNRIKEYRERIAELEKAAQAAALLFDDSQLLDYWDNLQFTLHSAGYLKE